MNFISEALESQSENTRTKKDQQSLETKFQLYTDKTEEGCQILFNQLETLDKCSFNASLPLVMIVHGWSVWTHFFFFKFKLHLIWYTFLFVMLVPKATLEERLGSEIWWISLVAIMARNTTKWVFPTEILKEHSTSNFSYESPMSGIRFIPGLKPEFEQAAELMCCASGGLKSSFISLISLLPDKLCVRLLKKAHTISPHLSHRYSFKENISISFFCWNWSPECQWITTELLQVKWLKKIHQKPSSNEQNCHATVNFDLISAGEEIKERIGSHVIWTNLWFS